MAEPDRTCKERRDAAVGGFKCSNYGFSYATDGEAEKPCPTCGNMCTRESCRVYQASSEGF